VSPVLSRSCPRPEPLDRFRLRRVLADGGPFSEVEVVEEVDSTNTALLAAGADLPHLTALLAEHQTAGRGRLDRPWLAPPRTSVLASVLLRPPVSPVLALTLLPLVAGLAVARAVSPALPRPARLAWPNDVVVIVPNPESRGEERPEGQVVPDDEAGSNTNLGVPGWGRWRKVAGLLAQSETRFAAGAPVGPSPALEPGAIVLGVGVNVAQEAAQLPVPWATSLGVSGPSGPDRTDVAIAVLSALASYYAAWVRGERWLRPLIEACCVSIGQDVEVVGLGGTRMRGRGVRLDDDGALVLSTPAGERRVTSGDVRSLRCRGRQ
jgi:BirA family biotin operon repressor/biotin-[acetyl-CoA-carboxylase] ligase